MGGGSTENGVFRDWRLVPPRKSLPGLRYCVSVLSCAAFATACALRGSTPVVAPEPEAPPVEDYLPEVDGPPSIEELWQDKIREVAPLTQSGKYAEADSLLDAFAFEYDGSCPAAEAGYYRALLVLLPENRDSATEAALPFIDRYLTSVCLTESRRSEVLLLRSIAVASTSRVILADSSAAAEIQSLRAQLEETRRELERLRLRVIPPRRE